MEKSGLSLLIKSCDRNIIMKNYILPLVLSLFLYQPLLSDIQAKKGSGSVYNVSYDQGLKDIHKLAGSSMVEDEYLFTDKWTDVGINEDEESVETDYKKLKDVVKDKKFRKASMIHIHPYKERLFSPPSFADLESYTEDEEIFTKLNCKLENLIADQNGIWTIVLSEKTKRAFSKGSIHPDYVQIENEYNEMKNELDNYHGKNGIEFAIELYKNIGVDLTYRKL